MAPQCFGDWWHLFNGEEQLAKYPRAQRDVMRSLAASAYAAGFRAGRPEPAPDYAINTTGLTPEQIEQTWADDGHTPGDCRRCEALARHPHPWPE